MNMIDYYFIKHNTDKSSKYHNYSRQYEDIFQKFKNRDIKYLEIGVYMGGSVKAMREIFPNAQCIVGVDIDQNCKQYEDVSADIYIEIGDATKSEFSTEINKKYGCFDIILDDGSHKNKDVIESFEILFPLLNDDGVYIVEDTNVYKFNNYHDNSYPTHLEYFFNFVKYLNQTIYDPLKDIHILCADPFKNKKKSKNIFECSIDKIEYGNSYIAIYKKRRKHWET